MGTLFISCAIFGGTVLIAQLLLGLGGDHDHFGDGHDGGADEAHHDGDHASDDHHDSHQKSQVAHTSNWLFGVLSFRTVMIGITMFGLTGKAATASEFKPSVALLVALGCGLAAMYGVYFLMRGLYRLTADGTERIDRAVGEEGTVYLTIPGGNLGVGKIHITLQNRLVEYEAMTSGEKLTVGTPIVVVGVLGSDRVVVEPASHPARNTHV